MATRDLLEIARRNAERAQQVLSNRQKREQRRKQMAEEHGAGKSVTQLVAEYGVSAETVRSDLKAEGVYTPQRRTKITPELRASIVRALTEAPEDAEEIATSFGVSFATVRKIGVAEGILEAGAKRTRRSDADFVELEKLDGDLRAVHGAGLQALGAALYAWQKRTNGKSIQQADPAVADLDAPAETPAPEPVAQGASDEAPWE